MTTIILGDGNYCDLSCLNNTEFEWSWSSLTSAPKKTRSTEIPGWTNEAVERLKNGGSGEWMKEIIFTLGVNFCFLMQYDYKMIPPKKILYILDKLMQQMMDMVGEVKDDYIDDVILIGKMMEEKCLCDSMEILRDIVKTKYLTTTSKSVRWKDFLKVYRTIDKIYFRLKDSNADDKQWENDTMWEEEMMAYLMRPGGYLARFVCERAQLSALEYDSQ